MKAVFQYPIWKKENEKAHLFMGISMGADYQTGESFDLFVDLINYHKAHIDQITLVPTGDLNRHFVALEHELSPKEAEIKARELGKTWVKKHQDLLDQIKPPLSIIHWEDFRLTATFDQSLKRTYAEYENNETFRQISNEVIEKFALKYQKRNEEKGIKLDIEDCFRVNKLYCLEEASIFSEFIEHGATVQVYPGKDNACMQYMYQKYTKNDPMPWIQYRFRKNPKRW